MIHVENNIIILWHSMKCKYCCLDSRVQRRQKKSIELLYHMIYVLLL